jgi:hypothetical protein
MEIVCLETVADYVRWTSALDGSFTHSEPDMSKILRGLAAGYGAKKLGGGCFSTVVIFLLLWWLLGHFGMFR